MAFENRALTPKRLEMMKEALPRISRVAVLWDPTVSGASGYKQAEMAARALHLRLQVLEIRGPADLESAFKASTTGRAEALLVLASPFLNGNRQTVVESAARRRPA
jgi:putative ABC transport system substrate-binding protein